MKPAPFRYARPENLREALEILADGVAGPADGLTGSDAGGDGVKVLAGGQSLVPLMALRLVQPEVVVDLERVGELHGIGVIDGALRVGAMTRHETLLTHPLVSTEAPLLARAAAHIGHRAIRTRGTLGGSLAHADPVAELPTVSVALEAQIELRSAHGERLVPASDFFEGSLTSCVQPDELVVAVRFPLATSRRPFGFAELARRHGDFALVLAAVTVSVDGDGGCRAATVALGGVSPTPVLLGMVGRILIGTRLRDADINAAVFAASAAVTPTGDLHAGADYRRAMAVVLLRRALRQARGEVTPQ
ncbi:MAG: FAD binding domain-containing protein [Acidimicrobiales bacterium]